MNGFEWALVLMIANAPGSAGQWDEIHGRALWDTGYRTETFRDCFYGHMYPESMFPEIKLPSFCYDDTKRPLATGSEKPDAPRRLEECQFWMKGWERVCLPVKKGFNP